MKKIYTDYEEMIEERKLTGGLERIIA